MIHGAFNHLDHVIDLGGMGASDKSSAGGNQFLNRINRMIDGSSRIGF